MGARIRVVLRGLQRHRPKDHPGEPTRNSPKRKRNSTLRSLHCSHHWEGCCSGCLVDTNGQQMSKAARLRFIMLAIGFAISARVSAAHVSAADEIGDYQNLCDPEHGYATFQKQVACIKSQIERSFNKSDPEIQLYVMTADKLIDDVRAKRTTGSAARVDLQKVYLDLVREDAHVAQAEAQTERLRVEQARQETLQREAIRACVSNVKLQMLITTDSRKQLELLMLLNNENALVAQCERNPEWPSRLRQQTTTRCSNDGFGDFTCRSQ